MRGRLAVVLAAGIGGTALYAALDLRRALFAWLAAFACALGVALGALVLVMILDVVGARWPAPLRPIMSGLSGALPVFAVLFLPIALGLRLVYPWAQPTSSFGESVRPVIEHQRAWNNPGAFLARSFVYLLTWSVLGVTLRRTPRFSAAGLPLVALTLTFAAYDWLMSLEAGWVSSAFGLYFFAGGLVGAVSLIIVLAWLARRAGLVPEAFGVAHFHALGRLLLVAVMFWAYVGFFQFMIVWIANVPREVGFYLARARGQFAVVSALLVVGHCALPLLALLSRSFKRSPTALAALAGWLLLMNGVGACWLVLPASTSALAPLDLAPFVAVFGIAFAYGGWRFGASKSAAEPGAVPAESVRYESP